MAHRQARALEPRSSGPKFASTRSHGQWQGGLDLRRRPFRADAFQRQHVGPIRRIQACGLPSRRNRRERYNERDRRPLLHTRQDGQNRCGLRPGVQISFGEYERELGENAQVCGSDRTPMLID